MSDNVKASEEENIEQINASEQVYPENTSKEKDQDDFEKEMDNYLEKRKNRNSVYTQRPMQKPQLTDTNSLFELNTRDYGDFLKKKHLFIISKYEQILLISSDLYKKIEENSKLIEELDMDLKKLKEEKKKKQSDIVNYLSNKESMEEIYKNKIRFIIRQKKIADSKDKEVNLNLDTSKDSNKAENQYYNIDDEKEIEITIEEIKNSDQAKFSEQVINLAEELFNKEKEEEFIDKVKSKVKIAYNIFFSEISSNVSNTNESIISHFLSRIGLYISNHSLGLYSETVINKFLRYLLKINSTEEEISQTMKFLNKKYKEQKEEIKNKIANLKETNEDLKEKKNINDIKIEKYEKIIQKNKELIKNEKENANNEEPKEKRRYTVHTLDRTKLRRGKNMNIGNKEEIEILKKGLINDNSNEYEIRNKPKKSKFYKNKENKSIEKNLENNDSENLNNQKFIVIKNNINVKNAEENNEIDNNFNNNLTEKRSNISNNNERIRNINEIKEKSKEEDKIIGNEQNIKDNNNYQKIKYNENIYIINNINNSEQIQTKNNIYNNKSNNLNIDSNNNYRINNINQGKEVKNISYNNSQVSTVNQRKNNNSNITSDKKTISSITSQKIQDSNSQKTYQKSSNDYKTQNNNYNVTKTQNIYGKNTDNSIKKTDNGTNDKNMGYKITVVPKRSEKKTE